MEDIVREVNGRCEVYLDCGVRVGTDVFKALALGANMVELLLEFLNSMCQNQDKQLFMNIGLCGSTVSLGFGCWG